MDNTVTKMSFRAPGELVQLAKQKASAEDLTVSQAIRWLLWRWVQGEIPTRPPQPVPEGEP